jgi:hypothetical protein
MEIASQNENVSSDLPHWYCDRLELEMKGLSRFWPVRVRQSKPSTIETGAENDLNWKCTSCGAENENFRQFCDGCGDPRPGTKLPSGGISMDELLAPKESFEEDEEASLDATVDSENVEAESNEPELDTSENFEDKFKPDIEKHEEVSSPRIEPVKTPSPPKRTGRRIEPETVSTGTFKSGKQKPKHDEEPFQQPARPEPISGQRLSLVFVNSPASSLIKSRVSLEFDDFPTVTVGRSPENVVVVPDQEVSRKHAQLSLERGRVLLKDLNSSNGTFLYDGKEFQRVGNDSVEVKPNSIIKFGTGTIVRLVTE